MIGFHSAEPSVVAEGHNFCDFDTVVDIGGGTGNMLATDFEHCPEPEGIFFELSRVVREVPELNDGRGLTVRITCGSGDFFEKVPEGGGAYILIEVNLKKP